MNTYRYISNNSGGSWWLSHEQWLLLEEAGWTVAWLDKPFFGAEAWQATVQAESEDAAIESFETATGEDYYEVGCECCGPPHYISMEWSP